MEKEFVKYEQALALKELGFDEPCFAWYVSESYGLEYGKVIQSSLIKDAIIAPTYSQAFRWFREKHNLNGILNRYPNIKLWDFSVHNLEWSIKEFIEYKKKEDRSIKFSIYEEAESACLDKLIEIVKNK